MAYGDVELRLSRRRFRASWEREWSPRDRGNSVGSGGGEYITDHTKHDVDCPVDVDKANLGVVRGEATPATDLG